jgi:hypothetical protein
MTDSQKYKVSYTYSHPCGAGPYKGRDILDWKPEKGDEIRAIFGMAIVQTVSKFKQK